MNNSFGIALADFMRQNHLTQQEVAERTGIAQPVIGRLLKTTQPELPTVYKIAKGLDVDIQIAATGEVVVIPLAVPSDLKLQSSTMLSDPYGVYFSIYDEHQKREIFEANLMYRAGEGEPYSVSYERKEGLPGFVSDYGLLRWAKAYAKQLIR